MGGVFAVANIRGGGEYGRDWHRAATKLKRPKAFDDFIAAAEWLIQNKYTRPDKLAIQGGSNGGLLVGAVMCKRPDLFGACLPAVGVMDMLRFHKFTAGRFWIDDYGSSDNAEEFKVLYSYSPYHNLKPGVQLSGDAGDDGGHGRSGSAVAQFQVHSAAAALPGRRRAGADPHRDARRPRRRPADGEGDRGSRRPVGVPGAQSEDDAAGGVLVGPGRVYV